MTFTCDCEIEISGGTEEDRQKAAALLLAVDSVDENSVSRREAAQKERGNSGSRTLVLRFESVDGLPEDELVSIAPQFPDLSLTLIYFSLDGEFFGYARAGAVGPAAESEDFAEDTRDIVGRRHEGDGIAFVRQAYSLERPLG